MLHEIAKAFNTSLYNAMEKELDTDTLIVQIRSFKDVIDEAGPGLMNGEEVNHISDRAIQFMNESLERIEQNNKLPGEEVEDEDD